MRVVPFFEAWLVMWTELEEFLTNEGVVIYMWLISEVQLLCICHYWRMLRDRGARMEHCLWKLLVQVLHLVLGLVRA